MGVALTIARRSLLQRPGRTLFSILGVAVGIATTVAIFTLDHNTILAKTGADKGEWLTDIRVRPGEEVADPRSDLLAMPGVTGISAFFEKDILIRARPGEQRKRVRMVSLELDEGERIGAFALGAGRRADPAAATPQVYVGAALAEELALAPGARIELAQPRRAAREICVEGEKQLVAPEGGPNEVLAVEVAGVLARERLGRRSRGRVVVVDYSLGLELYAGAFVDPSFWIEKDAEVDLERLETNLGQQYSYDVNRRGLVGQQADERAFRNGVRIAGLLALVLGLFVIFHTLSMSLVERVREVAVLHALGTSRGQVARVFFGEAVILAVAAGAAGLGGGLLLARFLLLAGVTTLGVGGGILDFSIPWEVVLPLVAMGVGIALLGSIYPLLRARGTDTVAALRGDELGQHRHVARGFHLFAAVLLVAVLPALYFAIVPVVGEAQQPLVGVILAGVGVLALLLGVPLLAPTVVGAACRAIASPLERRFPLSGLLAARSIRESPARIASSVAAIALVTAAFVGLKGMTNSLRAETETWAAEAVVDKVWVNGLPSTAFAELVAQLRRYPGVVGVEPADHLVVDDFRLVGVDVKALADFGPLAADPALAALMEEGRGMVLSRRLALHKRLGVGDRVLVDTTGSGVQSFPVVAVSDAYGYSPHPDERMYAVVSSAHLERFFCIDGETTQRIAVTLEPGGDEGVVEAAVRELFPGGGEGGDEIGFESGREVLRFHLTDITKDFFLFDIIFGLTALLAGLGVLNGQLLAALERSKELGVLRALGVSRGQVALTVAFESGVIGVCGGLLGLALGGALTPVIVEALQVISGLPLPHRSAGPWLAACLGGALLLTLAAGVYPIWRMNRIDAVRAVRTG